MRAPTRVGKKPSPGRRHESGLALVAVIWLLAALSLLVSAQVGATRAELRSLQTYRSFTEHAALGDGAIRLAMRDWASLPARHQAFSRVFTLGEHALWVEATPASAFIDLNSAPADLLADTLTFGAGVPAARAQAVSRAIQHWRDPEQASPAPHPATAAGRIGGFSAVEDLVQVPGVDLALYHRLAELVTVHNPPGGVDPRFASRRVLMVLTRGDTLRVDRIVAAREAGDPTLDIADLPHAQINHSAVRTVRMAASRRTGDAVLTRVRWIANERGANRALPWRELSAEPVRSMIVSKLSDED